MDFPSRAATPRQLARETSPSLGMMIMEVTTMVMMIAVLLLLLMLLLLVVEVG